MRLPYSFFRQYKAGELALRFGAIATVQREVQSLLSGGALQALLSGVFLLFMLRISVKLTALALLLAVFLVVPTVWIGRRYQRLERHREEDLAEASSRNLELITSVAKLRLAGVETAAARHWWQPYQQAITSGFRLEAQAAQAGLLQTVIPNLGTLLLFILITRLVAEAAATPAGPQAPNIGELLGFFAAFSTFIGAVASSAALMVRAFELPVLVERARPLLTAAPENEAQRLDPGPLEGAEATVQLELAPVGAQAEASGNPKHLARRGQAHQGGIGQAQPHIQPGRPGAGGQAAQHPELALGIGFQLSSNPRQAHLQHG